MTGRMHLPRVWFILPGCRLWKLQLTHPELGAQMAASSRTAMGCPRLLSSREYRSICVPGRAWHDDHTPVTILEGKDRYWAALGFCVRLSAVRRASSTSRAVLLRATTSVNITNCPWPVPEAGCRLKRAPHSRLYEPDDYASVERRAALCGSSKYPEIGYSGLELSGWTSGPSSILEARTYGSFHRATLAKNWLLPYHGLPRISM